VQTRTAYWHVEDVRSTWLALASSTTMCRFQADDDTKSRIYVDLTTLSATQPTLAALAYLSKVSAPIRSTRVIDIAPGYCTQDLGGSSSIGVGGPSHGGWVADDDPDDGAIALCVFADLSFIDQQGLADHSASVVRGTDLATAMRYQPGSQLPPVFPEKAVFPTR
jgi:hypothetical protein